MPDAPDNSVQIRMHERLAAADRDYRRAKFSQLINPAKHLFKGYGLGEIVELIAVLACQITAPHGNDVRQQGMVCGNERSYNFPGPAKIALRVQQAATEIMAGERQHWS